MGILGIIPKEKRENKRCYFCGTDLSVKYIVEVFDPVLANEPSKVCACNKCALYFNRNEIKLMEE